MRVVFMGTPQFAVPSLEALAGVSDVVGVFTRRDSVSGRGRSFRPSPVKCAATELGLPVFQPHTLRDPEAHAMLASLAPDLMVVAAYGLLLPPEVLEVAGLGAVNVHASLLPRWRGAAPIQRAILARDRRIGVSIMRMEVGLDTGPYCLQLATDVGQANAEQLTSRLAGLGAAALIEALPSIAGGSAVWTPQDEALVTYAEKISKEDVAIAPGVLVADAILRVRASSAAAPCRVIIANRTVTVLGAEPSDQAVDGAPIRGTAAATTRGVLLGMADGGLLVTRLRPDGKGEMAASDWARGVRDIAGATWGRSL